MTAMYGRMIARIDTTPRELREIADLPEARYAKCECGDEVPKCEIAIDRSFSVMFAIDQGRVQPEDCRPKPVQ